MLSIHLKTASQIIMTSEEFKWKWITIALHHSLYSFCISCQSQGNYDNVLSSGHDDINSYAQMGNDEYFRESIREYIYKTPAYRIKWKVTNYRDEKEIPLQKISSNKLNKLISFWTALARVQDGYYWMGRLINIKPLILNDDQIRLIAHLTMLRNEIIHFVPKTFGINR